MKIKTKSSKNGKNPFMAASISVPTEFRAAFERRKARLIEAVSKTKGVRVKTFSGLIRHIILYGTTEVVDGKLILTVNFHDYDEEAAREK